MRNVTALIALILLSPLIMLIRIRNKPDGSKVRVCDLFCRDNWRKYDK